MLFLGVLMARVELDKIGKRYPNGFEAVEAFSLDIADREFIVLVGPSGCGKSTTLRMVAGLETITTGEMRIDGVRVNELPPKKRDVAMVFQSYALYPHMTVRENMAFGLELQKLPKEEIRKRVEEVAERLEIKELLDRKPKAMSGGQRQRVAMGRAIVRHPKVFLFDEPLSNLDAKLRLQMRVEVSRLHHSLGATSIYVTHDQVEAMTLADRIVLMKRGKVQQIGRPLDLYDRPCNLFVATFIGSPSMNVVEAKIEDGRICGEGFKLPLDARWQAQSGQKIQLGVRPQHLFLTSDTSDSLRAQVEVVEPMGCESNLYCRTGKNLYTVRQEGVSELRPGDHVNLSFDTAHLHLFDAESEKRIGEQA